MSDVNGLIAGTTYVVKLGGLQNPRYMINDLKFTIETFDSDAFLDGSVAEQHLIDSGTGASVSITEVSEIQEFSVEAMNTTNGAET